MRGLFGTVSAGWAPVVSTWGVSRGCESWRFFWLCAAVLEEVRCSGGESLHVVFLSFSIVGASILNNIMVQYS